MKAPMLGATSILLLGASVRWAHHWNAGTVALVAGWAVTTVAALFVSIRSRHVSRGLARLGLSFALVSVLALVAAGVLYAAGYNAAGACGGG